MTKLLLKIKKTLKNNYIFFIGLILGFFIFYFELPYYILAPGGISDVSKRIEISNHSIKKEAFNLTYLYEFRATISTFLYSKFNKDWDIYSKAEIQRTNETIKEADLRDQLLLKEANQNAIIVAYNKANKKYKIMDEKIIVSYVVEDALTNLKINDEIIKVNGKSIENVESFKNYIESLKANDVINFEVKENNKIKIKKGTIQTIDGKSLIGILLALDKELETDPEIKIKFSNKESGPSGGLMLSLAIYDTLTNYSISSDKIAGTGTIDELGNVGEIGGITYKIKSAVKNKIKYFLVPYNNYEEAFQFIEKNNYKIHLEPILTFDEAVSFLKGLK